MKEINKYYTPEIEEFYEGFEFEVLGEVDQKPGWVKATFKQGYFIICDPVNVDYYSNLQERIDAGDLRVKYLEREDVESLGFKYIDYNTFSKKLINGECVIKLPLGNPNGKIGVDYYTNDYGNGLIYGFYIEIKNISELKRLLKQLNIELDE